jgi:hypothetical protein
MLEAASRGNRISLPKFRCFECSESAACLKRKENSPPRLPPSLYWRFLLPTFADGGERRTLAEDCSPAPANLPPRHTPTETHRNINLFPFLSNFESCSAPQTARRSFVSGLSSPKLGPTHSSSNALHWKPFLASAQRILAFVIATTIKIYTSERFRRRHRRPLSLSPRQPTWQKVSFSFLPDTYQRMVLAPSIFRAGEFGR